MIVCIAGSRNATDALELVDEAVRESGFNITEVVEGGQRGIDYFAKMWAEENDLTVTTFKADWSEGLSGGPRRNAAMAKYIGVDGGLVLIWNGSSKGSASMLREAIKAGVRNIFQKIVNFP